MPRAAEQGLQSFPKQLVPILSGEIVGGDSSGKLSISAMASA